MSYSCCMICKILMINKFKLFLIYFKIESFSSWNHVSIELKKIVFVTGTIYFLVGRIWLLWTLFQSLYYISMLPRWSVNPDLLEIFDTVPRDVFRPQRGWLLCPSRESKKICPPPRGFNGSVNIPESCDFRSQFDPLNIIC